MAFYRDRILPHLVDRACGTRDLQRWRGRVAEGLSGQVVEIGFGSGLNLAAYPPEVSRLYAVEPARVARAIAAPRIESVGFPVEHVGIEGASIPLPDDSCDSALCTFTLCTVPEVDAALAELRRVLKPGGRFHFLEHGASPDARVAAWQRRIEPVQKVLADGCHLTRDPLALAVGAGFVVERHESRYGKGPKPWTWFTEAFTVNPPA